MQIQLDEEDLVALKAEAARSGRSVSDCVREGVALFLRLRRASAGRVAEVAGRYRAGPVDDLADHDRGWVEAIDPDRSDDDAPAPG